MLTAEELAGEVPDRPPSVREHPAPGEVADFLHDESKLSARRVESLAVPDSVGELRRVLRWHAERGHAVAVSATRTGVTGGGVPGEGAHLVSLSALRGVLHVDAEGEPPTATVLAGTWLSELSEWLAANHPGLEFPVDPTERSASLGGMVATNAGGARSYRFGSTREWVEGITVELASGRTLRLRRGVHRASGRVVTLRDGDQLRTLDIDAIPKPATKNAIGYGFATGGDVLDLFVGAEGTLGVVSEVTVRLLRQVESRMGFLQFFDAAQTAFAFVDALRNDASLAVTAVEFLDARSHQLARESGKPAVDRVLGVAGDAACSVFAEIGYVDDEGLATVVERLDAMVAAVGGDLASSLAGVTEDSLRDIRVFRHAVPEQANAVIAQRRQTHPALHKIATDMAVTDRDLPWVHELYRSRLSEAGLDFAIFGHVGDNHFHVNILPRDDGELQRARELYLSIAREVVSRGGSVSAEHGIGRLKKHFLAVQYDAATLDAFRAVKRWADPAWRLNPGVLLDP